MVKTLIIGLVHHNETERVRSQRLTARQLESALKSDGFETSFVEECEQKIRDFRRIPWVVLLVRVFLLEYRQEILHMKQSRFRSGRSLRLKPRKRLRVAVAVFRRLNSQELVRKAAHRYEIQRAVAVKHLAVWRRVNESQADGALVFEDDFSLRHEKSVSEVVRLLRKYQGKADVLDLAGGLTREELSLPPGSGRDLKVGFIVANTACAYFVNSRTTAALDRLAQSKSHLLDFSPDFFMSSVSQSGFAGTTVLPWDLPLVHGSREGRMTSSIPY